MTEQLTEKNECQPIADIEKLLEENRILRDKVDRLQHINAALVAHTPKLDQHRTPTLHTRSYPGPSVIKKRKSKSRGKSVTFEGDESGRGSSFLKSVKEKVSVEGEIHNLQQLILDMQKVSNGLAETVLDKNIALKHQRASNRLLGERVTELEGKLRALEMSGFWNVPDDVLSTDNPARESALKRLTLGEGDQERSEREGDLLSYSTKEDGGTEVTALLLDTEGWQVVRGNDEEECSNERSGLLKPGPSEDLCDLLPVKEAW